MFVFKLKDTISELGITMNKLSVESKVRSNTIIDYANNKALRLDLKTLDDILGTLNRLAEEKGLERRYDLSDIVQYKPNDMK